MWTQFWDMHSGGGTKEAPYDKIYIEAPEDQAKVIFYNKFGHNPERVTCTCCGEDYSISEHKTLEQATAFHRNCAYGKKGYIEKQKEDLRKYVRGGKDEKVWQAYLEKRGNGAKYQTLEKYAGRKDVLIIRKNDIKKEDLVGEVPEQGYVWR